MVTEGFSYAVFTLTVTSVCFTASMPDGRRSWDISQVIREGRQGDDWTSYGHIINRSKMADGGYKHNAF